MSPLTLWHRLVPRPEEIESIPGEYVLPARCGLYREDPVTPSQIDRITDAFVRVVGPEAPRLESCTDPEKAQILARRDPSISEGFRLSVTPRTIEIDYAVEEMLPAALALIAQALLLGGDRRLPCTAISDRPRNEWRGMMFDAARHFFPLESLERTLDILWLYRLNRLHLHLTDDQGWRLSVPGYPKLTDVGAWRSDGTSEDERYGGFYSAEELRALDASAHALGITIVPEIDLPGHATAAVAAYPELLCSRERRELETRWGIFDAVLCVSRDTTMRFIEVVFAAVAEQFSGPYIHIGGDEVLRSGWDACPDCRPRDDPYQEIVAAMCTTVLRLGRRPVAWDEASGLNLPRETIVINWRTPDAAARALERGYDLVLAPESRCYLDRRHRDTPLEPGRLSTCTVVDSASFAPARYVAASEAGGVVRRDTGTAAATGAATILGGQANLWTEEILYHSQFEYMALVRLAAIAEGLWTGEPAAERPGFYENLDALRHALWRRGYDVYPGPLTE